MESANTQTETNVQKNDNIVDKVKNTLNVLMGFSSQIKGLVGEMRAILKDVEKQDKDIEKYRNKKNRNSSHKKAASGTPSGITKPVAISDELAKFLGVTPGTLVPRNEVTKGVSVYVKKFDLADPTNKQKFLLDGRPEALVLKVLLGNPEEEVTYFNLQRYLKQHYIMNTTLEVKSTVPVSVKKIESDSVTKVESAGNNSDKQLKKKIIIKKKRSELTNHQELVEE